MEDKPPFPDAASPSFAASLTELPIAVQNYLTFGTIVTALGFDPGAIGHRVVRAPAISEAGDCVRSWPATTASSRSPWAWRCRIWRVGSHAARSCARARRPPPGMRCTIDACSSRALGLLSSLERAVPTADLFAAAATILWTG
jgi:hypothetical protein